MSSSDKQNKTELNISTHQNKDKSGDYGMHDADKDKTKHEKTSITFERKKQCDDKSCQEKDHHHAWNKDKDLNKDKEFHFESKDVNKDKDWNKDLNKDKDLNLRKDKDIHDKSEGESKGIINTIKEKVKDVLGSGDNDKSKDKEKDVQMDYNKKDKDVHMSSSADYNKNKDVKEFGSSAVGTSAGSAQYQSNLGASSGAGTGYHTSNLGATNLSSDKQFSGTAYSGAGQATVDHKNLGAEHRELGYEKQPNVIPSKEKDKEAVHKVDVHGSLYTSGAGSTFKTNEAK